MLETDRHLNLYSKPHVSVPTLTPRVLGKQLPNSFYHQPVSWNSFDTL